MAFSEDDLKKSFQLFLIYAWKQLGLPSPTPIQLDIAHYLQFGGRRIGIQAFRGVGKSWITSAFVCWLLYCDSSLKILVVSASKERSDSFSTFTRRLIWEFPILAHLKPSKNQGDRISNVAFDVRGAIGHAPSVKSVGITGQMTGSRADYIIADDVEVVNNSETATQREKLRNLVAEMGGAILTPKAQAGDLGGIVFLGTPQVEESLYPFLATKGYQFKIWPARVPAKADIYNGNLGPCVQAMIDDGAPAGTPTDPLRFDNAELNERQIEYGKIGFALQFQLDTTLNDADRHPLKLRDFIVAKTDIEICPDKFVWGSGEDQEMAHLPLVGLQGDRFYRALFTAERWSPYEGKILYVDPSGRGQDLTGLACIAMLHGQLIVRRWLGLEGGYSEATLTKIATIAKKEAVNTIVVESNFGDGMFAQLLRPVCAKVGASCGIEDDHVTGQKEARIIDNLEPALAAHRLVLDEEVITSAIEDRSKNEDHDAALKTAFFQLTRLTRDKGCLKYDDLIDALAGGVRWWTERMARDTDLAVLTRDEEVMDQMIQDFANGLSIDPRKNRFARPLKREWAPVLRP